MTIIPKGKGEFFKYFYFVHDFNRRDNICYHLMYLDFLYKINKQNNPQSVTQSLLFKTLIIEYGVVIEAILDDLLSQMSVHKRGNYRNDFHVRRYAGLKELIHLAEKYKIINIDIAESLELIKDYRNRIHIKRLSKDEKEWHYYTKEKVIEVESVFKALISHLYDNETIRSVDEQVSIQDFPFMSIGD